MKAYENVSVKYFRSCEVDLVKAFYKNTNYKNITSVQAEDKIVAAYRGDNMIGLFRLCSENGIIVLRGFNVWQEYQRSGIGTQMLKIFESQLIDEDCYLICKKQLNEFYAQANFEICTKEIPDFLVRRKAGYSSETLNILVRKGTGN